MPTQNFIGGHKVTDQDKELQPEQASPAAESEQKDEFAELEQSIRRRLRSNQRFLERFMDEDFDDEEFPDEEEEGTSDEEL
jgi:hypothetical protein